MPRTNKPAGQFGQNIPSQTGGKTVACRLLEDGRVELHEPGMCCALYVEPAQIDVLAAFLAMCSPKRPLRDAVAGMPRVVTGRADR